MKAFVFYILLLTTLFVQSCQCATEKNTFGIAPEGANDAVVFMLTGVQGFIEPCGCTADPLGGVARMRNVVDDIKAKFHDRAFFVDAGNLLFDHVGPAKQVDLCQDEARIDVLLKSLRQMQLQATVLGEKDLARGYDWYKQALQRYNIDTSDKIDGKLLAGRFQIGVVRVPHQTNVNIETIKTAVRTQAQALRAQGARLVMVLSQLSDAALAQVMASQSDVDIVIDGHNVGETPKPPYRLGQSPWILSAGPQAQHLGVLHIHVDNQNERFVFDDRLSQKSQQMKIVRARIDSLNTRLKETNVQNQAFLMTQLERAKGQLAQIETQTFAPLPQNHLTFTTVALSRDIKAQADTAQLVAKYDASIPALTARCEQDRVCPQAKPNEPTFVGAETCKSCHAQAYDVWKKAIVMLDAKDKDGIPTRREVGHARAWQTLVDMNKQFDRTCVGCHSIGFDQPGGFCKVADVGFRANVQCESCHGAGSEHAKTGNKALIRRQVSESTCRECHHPPHIATTESFVFDDKVQHVLGKGHGEALLNRLRHGASVP